jgi:hypothetical protein
MEIWKKIRTMYPVWFFDATGGILRNVDDLDTLWYSIICYDPVNKKTIPFYEFATNKNTSLNISKNLKNLKHIISNEFKDSTLIASLIVIDECMAMLNAALDVFNNGCHLSVYLDWAFSVIHDKKKNNHETILRNNMYNTRVIFCHIHLFRNFVKKSNTILNFKNNKNSADDAKISKIKLMFNYCITVLQNCTLSDDLMKI